MASRPKRLSDLPLEKKVDELLEGHYTAAKDNDGHSTSVAVPEYVYAQAGWVLEMVPEFRSKQAVIRDAIHVGLTLRVQQLEAEKFERQIEMQQAVRIIQAHDAEQKSNADFLQQSPGFITSAQESGEYEDLQGWLEKAEAIVVEWGGSKKMQLEQMIANAKSVLENAKVRGEWEPVVKLASVTKLTGYSDERFNEMFGE